MILMSIDDETLANILVEDVVAKRSKLVFTIVSAVSNGFLTNDDPFRLGNPSKFRRLDKNQCSRLQQARASGEPSEPVPL